MATYLDHASTTPMVPEALATYVAVAGEHRNPSSLHAGGRAARRLVEESREKTARLLGCRPSEVIFTGGGTEADNLAVKGIYWARRDADPHRTVIISSPIEHHAVLDALSWLAEHEQAEPVWLPVDEVGRVSAAKLATVLDEYAGRVALVTVMWVNNEIGTIEPVAELSRVAAKHEVPLHTDAVQAVGQLPVDFSASGASALSFTGHKLGGPTGIGALLLGREVTCTPLLHGGGQERSVRSGTLDVVGISSFAVAVELAVAGQPELSKRLTQLREDLIARVLRIPGTVLNGDLGDGRLPGNAHFSFPGCEGDALLMLLDAAGVECSTGSACTSGVPEPSHVLLAMGVGAVAARESLRFSLGRTSTTTDIDALMGALGAAVERARCAGVTRR
ncbi:MAG: cysteine desulfurase NifS [Acidimicrobiales bacterium]|nr:MAG: cysteine desulfurase NifS [Acidimicrobiales bacterium]